LKKGPCGGREGRLCPNVIMYKNAAKPIIVACVAISVIVGSIYTMIRNKLFKDPYPVSALKYMLPNRDLRSSYSI
jgi:hypothetical protein